MRTLYFDIETAPMVALHFRQWDSNAMKVIQEPYVMMVGYRLDTWKRAKTIQIWDHAEPVHPTLGFDPKDSKSVIERFYEIIDKYDVQRVCGHNSDKFDVKWMQGQGLVFGLGPMKPMLQTDTVKLARKHGNHRSNSLADLCEIHGIAPKHKPSHDLWHRCMTGEKAAEKEMEKYCKQDVNSQHDLHKIYAPLDNLVVSSTGCPNCGSPDLTKNGKHQSRAGIFYQQYRCNSCGKYSRARRKTPDIPSYYR